MDNRKLIYLKSSQFGELLVILNEDEYIRYHYSGDILYTGKWKIPSHNIEKEFSKLGWIETSKEIFERIVIQCKLECREERCLEEHN